MKRENLVKKLGKKVLPYVLSGALAIGSLLNYRCANEFVELEPEKPVAMLIVDPTEGDVPLEVNFDGSLSYVRTLGSYLEKYLWDFDGDGNTDLTTSGVSGAWVDHVYDRGGEYDPSLVVVDNQGQKSNKAKLLEKIVVNENVLGRIAFWSNRDQGTGELYLADITKNDLENIKRLTNNNNNDIWPAWSSDGRYLVWSANRATPDGWFALYVVDPSETDGDDERRITPFIDGFSAYDPIWCTNGKIYFNFLDRNSGEQGIAVINSDGEGGIQRIVKRPFFDWLSRRPACSPDGSQIAFTDLINGNVDIYSINSDGDETSLRRLTTNPEKDSQPVWSPDGNYVLFKSHRSGSDDLHLMDKKGVYIGRLTDDLGIETDPNFSSDGNKIIFAHDIDMSNPQIYLMNVDGTGEWTQLTFGGAEGANCYPAWRPEIKNQNFN